MVLVLVTVSLVILAALGVGVLTAAYGNKLRSIQTKNDTAAMLIAEGGYEKVLFWMGQQKDMLTALQQNFQDSTGTVNFPTGYCDYQVELYSFVGSRPVYRVVSKGYSGGFNRTVDVFVIQAIGGWDIDTCRIPTGHTATVPAYFAKGEEIDMPLYINRLGDTPDERDIYVQADHRFLQNVAMGESRYTTFYYDKYYDVMGFFKAGICFDQPSSKIADQDCVQSKITRFKNCTKTQFCFKPLIKAFIHPSLGEPAPAVQLEFFVENGVGKVRITNDCTVLGYQRTGYKKTLDYKIRPDHHSSKYEEYCTYSYHYMPKDAEASGCRFTRAIEDTYVSQSCSGVKSAPGGQIFVNGNVVIGGDKLDHDGDQVVKGRITVVATGNIWIADRITVDGSHDGNGLPTMDNPNALGLVAQGVVKIVDPGMSAYNDGDKNDYPGPPKEIKDFVYVPIGRSDGAEQYKRHLPDPMIVEAAITTCGGGWGAENVQCGKDYGGRKEQPGTGPENKLMLHGCIAEAVRGVVHPRDVDIGTSDKDGFVKRYCLDRRLLRGILPGDIWLTSKYVPAPAGWHDYRTTQ